MAEQFFTTPSNNMSEEEGRQALEETIANHILGATGSAVKVSSISDILYNLAAGPRTLAALQILVAEVAVEYTYP